MTLNRSDGSLYFLQNAKNSGAIQLSAKAFSSDFQPESISGHFICRIAKKTPHKM